MAVLRRPKETIYTDLARRRAIEAGSADVLVVGGGIAGMAAAWGAANAGAKVILVEKEGFLGGDATASMVTILMSYRSQHPCKPGKGVSSLFPDDWGDGIAAVKGFYLELVRRLVDAHGAVEPSPGTGFTLTLDPEALKLIGLDMMDEAGVELLFFASAGGVIGGPRIQGVIFDTKSGPLVLRGQTVVDCTGDGDVAALAGAPFALGREKDGLTQPVSLFFIMGGFDKERFDAYCRGHPDQWEDVFGLDELMAEAERAGVLDLKRENILMFATPWKDKVVVDSTRVNGINATDVWDLSRAAAENQRQVGMIASFLRKYVPGFEHAGVERSGSSLYVRESRRILGDYILTSDDVLEGRKFPDVVARGGYCIDLHNPAGKGTFVRHLPPGVVYDIPLRCLLPKDTDNLLVADRAISGTHVALASYRILPIGAATGQAAGVCAAMAARRGISCREVDVRELQDALLGQGADLGEITSKPATSEEVFNRRLSIASNR